MILHGTVVVIVPYCGTDFIPILGPEGIKDLTIWELRKHQKEEKVYNNNNCKHDVDVA
jgi:hypothetical protein